MKNKALVSIVIPTFNRREVILRSINSIINQTYTNIEIIIVDDASTDDTQEMIASIKDDRVFYIRNKKNLGVAKSRNIGAMASHGDYIAFNDSDDVWLEDKLEKQIEVFISNSNCELCYCSYILHNNEILTQFPRISMEEYKLNGNIYKYLLCDNWIGTPTMVVSKKAFMNVGGFNKNLRALDDWELVIKISRLYEVKFLNEVLVHAYYSPDGITAGNNKYFHNAQAVIEIIKVNKNFNKNTKDLNILYEFLIQCLLNLPEDKLAICKKTTIPYIFTNDFIFDKIMDNEKNIRYLYPLTLRLEEKNKVLIKLTNRDRSINKIKEYLRNLNIKTVAIYGYGDIGKILLEYLLEIDIDVRYIVDRNENIESDYCLVTPDSNLQMVDLLIISIIDNEFKTVELVRTKFNGKIVRLQDIM